MRAGRLKTRRYKVRRRGLGWLLLAVGIALGAAARPLMNGEWRTLLPSQLLPARPVSTPAPQDSQAAERTFTLAGSTWYALELGAFDSAEEAQALASSFRGRGAGGYAAWQDNAWRVLAAAYATRSDAQAVISQLRRQHQVEAGISPIIQPEVTLRLSGRQSQLTALCDAYDALSRLPEQLSVLSGRLDRRSAEREEILSALISQQETLSALKKRLAQQFGQSAPDAVKDAEKILADLSLTLDEALAAQGSTALGAQIKYAQLQCLCRMADYAAALAK